MARFAAGLLIALGVMAAPAQADEIPELGWSPHYYFSTDMSLVEVSFARLWYDEAGTYKVGRIDPITEKFVEGAPVQTVTLPRAYIYAFETYHDRPRLVATP